MFWIDRNIGNMNCSAFESDSASNAVATGTNWIVLHKLPVFPGNIEGCSRPKQLAIETEKESAVGSAKLDRALGPQLQTPLADRTLSD